MAEGVPPANERDDSDRVRVRYVREDDCEVIADHLGRAFERWPPYEIDCSVSEHVDWKLHANEGSWRQQVVATLEDDDRYVVAFALRIRRPAWIRQQPRVLLDVCDQSVPPEWRMMHINDKRGDFRRANGHETHDLQMTWLPNHPATRKGNLERPTLGNWVLVFIRPAGFRSRLSIAYRSGGARHALRSAFVWMRSRMLPARTRAFAGTVEPLERFDERTDALWERVKPSFEFAVSREQSYLNWRYADPRAGRFRIWAAIRDGRVVGYSVTKPGGTRGAIVDLLVDPDEVGALDALIADAVARVGSDAAGRGREISCWLPGRHPYVPRLLAHGFFDSGRDPSLRYRAMAMTEDELRFLLDPRLPVHVTQGDSDFV